MSYWRARAMAREVSDVDLREKLTEAYELLCYIADAVDPQWSAGSERIAVDCRPNIVELPEMAAHLNAELNGEREERQHAEYDRDEAQERLERYLQDRHDVDPLVALAEAKTFLEVAGKEFDA